MSIDSEPGDPTRGSWLMANIIAEPCIRTVDTTCVDVCPVDCILPAKGRTYDDARPTFDQVPLLYIDTTECNDCGAWHRPVQYRLLSRWMIFRRSGTRTSRSTRITLMAVSFSPTSIKNQVADSRLGTSLGTYEYTARNHS